VKLKKKFKIKKSAIDLNIVERKENVGGRKVVKGSKEIAMGRSVVTQELES
jgi:hypothetical protein